MSELDPASQPEPRGTGSAHDFLPDSHSLPVLQEAVQRCQGCGLYAFATQAVFGEGRKRTLPSGRAPGKRRLHDKPNTYEVTACKPWLEEEMRAVKPRIVVCLGSTAAQGLLGKQFRVTKDRGQFFESEAAALITATVHPSSILRAADDPSRQQEMAAFIRDLEAVAEKLEEV